MAADAITEESPPHEKCNGEHQKRADPYHNPLTIAPLKGISQTKKNPKHPNGAPSISQSVKARDVIKRSEQKTKTHPPITQYHQNLGRSTFLLIGMVCDPEARAHQHPSTKANRAESRITHRDVNQVRIEKKVAACHVSKCSWNMNQQQGIEIRNRQAERNSIPAQKPQETQ